MRINKWNEKINGLGRTRREAADKIRSSKRTPLGLTILVLVLIKEFYLIGEMIYSCTTLYFRNLKQIVIKSIKSGVSLCPLDQPILIMPKSAELGTIVLQYFSVFWKKNNMIFHKSDNSMCFNLSWIVKRTAIFTKKKF